MLAAIVGALILASTAAAVPAAPVKLELTQPSGQSLEAKQFGDEWYHGYETTSGYTILRDPETRAWRYAKRAAGGELAPAGPRATAEPPSEVRRHLRSRAAIERAEARRESIAGISSLDDDLTKAPDPPNTGNQPALVILVQFADSPSLGSTAAQWSSRYFGASNSVNDYYAEVSFDNLNITPASESHGRANDGVVGWLTLARDHPRGGGTATRETVRDAIIAADPYVNYAAYDKDGNGRLSADELHVTVVPAGYETASCGTDVQPSTWAHYMAAAQNPPTVDGKQVGDSYTMLGEMHCSSSGALNRATLGVMVHELAHGLGLPDLYDVSNESAGVGSWSMMAGGAWLSLPGDPRGSKPPHLDAWSKSYQGWITPRNLGGTQSLAQAATSPSAIQVGDNPNGVDWTFRVRSGTGEYFLVENRQKTGYDAALPGCGLIIWHIDETRTFTNLANADQNRRLVDIEEADNNGWPHDAGDAWLGQPFNDNTAPDSRYYSGGLSGLGVANGGTTCAETMSTWFTNSGGGSAAPTAAITSGPSGTVNQTTASFAFAASKAGSTFQCRLDAQAFRACASPRSYGGLPDGAHTFRVRATDSAGNTGPAVSRNWTVNTVAPPTNTTRPSISGPARVGETLKVSDGTWTGQGPITYSYQWARCDLEANRPVCDNIAGATSSSYTLGARDVDRYLLARVAARNAGGTTTATSQNATAWVVDPPPTTTITSGPSGTVSQATASFVFAASKAGSTFQCRLDAQAFSPCVSPRSYSGLAQGAHTFSVRATDAAGNTGPAVSRNWTVDTVAPPPPPSGGSPPPSGGLPPGGDSPSVIPVSNQFAFGKLKRNTKKGTARLAVRVPGAGTVALAKTKQLERSVARAGSASLMRVQLRPRGKVKRKLARALRLKSTVRLRVRARVTYRPIGGQPRTKTQRIRLVRRG